MTTAAAVALPTLPATGARVPTGAATARASATPRLEATALGLAVVLLPILVPPGPGNTALVDVGVALAVVATGLWGATRRVRWRVPYATGVVLLMAGGGIAALSSGAPVSTGLALFQDVFLLAWAAAVANAGRDPALLRVTLRAWALSGVAWAAVMVAGVVAGVDAISGVTAADGSRAAFTFGDPNLAANYFLVTLFIVRATRTPRHAVLRWTGCGLLVTAMVFTGSNGGATGLVIATTAGALMGLARRGGTVVALGIGATVLALAIGLGPHVPVAALQERAAQSITLLHDSVGRSAESSVERETIIAEALRTRRETDPAGLGFGPGRTKDRLRSAQAPYVKEAHDDYLATLVERGPLGVLGFGLLVGSAGARMLRLATGRLRREYAETVPRPELLLAVGAAFLLAGVFYETLHFRHLWALLGVAAGLDLFGRQR